MDLTDPIDFLADGFLFIFGNPIVISLAVIGLIVYTLLTVDSGKSVIVVILIPLVTTITSAGVSKYIGLSGNFVWVNLALWLILGIIFAAVYWVIVQ